MNCGQVYQSIPSWQKLSSFAMNPIVALEVLRYVKLVEDEHAIIDKQRSLIIRDITKTADGETASIEDGSPQYVEFMSRFMELLSQESSLESFSRSLSSVLEAIRGEGCELAVSDLARIDPFFRADVAGEPDES